MGGTPRPKTAAPGLYFWMAALGAICAALALAPATAMAKKVSFQGPVNQPFIPSPAGFSVDAPTMQLKVKFVGKKPKLIPGGSMKSDGIYGTCAVGVYGCTDYPGEARQCFWANGEVGDDVRIKNRRFSVTWRDYGVTGDYIRITGRVTKKSVTGTVHGYAEQEADDYHPAATCDTGVLSWSATR